ncbi:MAG TPA: cytochrome c [Leptolinea sp.]
MRHNEMRLFYSSTGRIFKPIHNELVLTAALAVILLLSGCAEAGQMRYQPRYNPLSATNMFADGRSARPGIANTVSYSADISVTDPINTGLDTKGQPINGIPVPVTQALINEGQIRYNIYCIPCHGPGGKGDGKVIAFDYPKPPDLLSDDIVTSPNSDIFAAITDGFQNMYSYGYRVKPAERWAIIAYIRALQLNEGQSDPQELTPADLDQIGKNP